MILKCLVNVSHLHESNQTLLASLPFHFHLLDFWHCILELWVTRSFMPAEQFEGEVRDVLNRVLATNSESIRRYEHELSYLPGLNTHERNECLLGTSRSSYVVAEQASMDREEQVRELTTQVLRAVILVGLSRVSNTLDANVLPVTNGIPSYCFGDKESLNIITCSKSLLAFNLEMR